MPPTTTATISPQKLDNISVFKNIQASAARNPFWCINIPDHTSYELLLNTDDLYHCIFRLLLLVDVIKYLAPQPRFKCKVEVFEWNQDASDFLCSGPEAA